MTPFLVALALSALPIVQGASPASPSAPVVLGPRPVADFAYVETWFYLMTFSNGYRFDANAFLSNMSLKKMSPAVEFALFTPEGERLAYRHYGDPKEARYDRAGFDLSIRENRFRGSLPEFRLTVGDGDLGADLTLRCPTPPWRYGDGLVRFGTDREKFWEFFVACPKGVASGVLKVKGKEIPVEGVGYHDHSRQNIVNTEYSRRWFNLRLIDGPAVLDAIEFESKEGRHVGAWVALDGDRIASEGSTCDYEFGGVAPDPEFGHPLPATIAFRCPGRVTAEGTITTERTLEAIDVLAQLPWVIRTFIKAFIAQPYIYRLANRYELVIHAPEGDRKAQGKGFEELDFLKE